MKTYRVFVHPDRPAPVVVKDGFCWPAFLLGPLWFLVNGMWLNFLLVAMFFGGADMYFYSKPPSGLVTDMLAAVHLVVWILIGAFANWLLSAELVGKGYELRGNVQATGMWKASNLAQRHAQEEREERQISREHDLS